MGLYGRFRKNLIMRRLRIPAILPIVHVIDCLEDISVLLRDIPQIIETGSTVMNVLPVKLTIQSHLHTLTHLRKRMAAQTSDTLLHRLP